MATSQPIQVRFSTPVPVTVHGQVPVTAYSPLPVVEQHWPPTDPYSKDALIVAVIGLFVSLVAAGAAIAAAHYARKTLAKVVEQIGIQRDELASVNADLAITQPLLKRKPNLLLRFEDEELQTTLNGQDCPVTLWVLNKGDKTARDVLLRLIIPPPFGWRQPMSPSPAQTPIWPRRRVNRGGIEFDQLDILIPTPCYPKFNVVIQLQSQSFSPVVFTHALLWRLACDDGTFPDDEDWGALAVNVAP